MCLPNSTSGHHSSSSQWARVGARSLGNGRLLHMRAPPLAPRAQPAVKHLQAQRWAEGIPRPLLPFCPGTPRRRCPRALGSLPGGEDQFRGEGDSAGGVQVWPMGGAGRAGRPQSWCGTQATPGLAVRSILGPPQCLRAQLEQAAAAGEAGPCMQDGGLVGGRRGRRK